MQKDSGTKKTGRTIRVRLATARESAEMTALRGQLGAMLEHEAEELLASDDPRDRARGQLLKVRAKTGKTPAEVAADTLKAVPRHPVGRRGA